MKANGALTKSEAASQARLAIAKESRKSRKSDAFYKKHPVIKGARGRIIGAKNVIKQSETLRELGNMVYPIITSSSPRNNKNYQPPSATMNQTLNRMKRGY